MLKCAANIADIMGPKHISPSTTDAMFLNFAIVMALAFPIAFVADARGTLWRAFKLTGLLYPATLLLFHLHDMLMQRYQEMRNTVQDRDAQWERLANETSFLHFVWLFVLFLCANAVPLA